MKNYSLEVSWPYAVGAGVAVSFQITHSDKPMLRRMACQFWVNNGAGPAVTSMAGHVYVRSNTGGQPTGEILDLTVFPGVTIRRNFGEPWCNVSQDWYGCQPMSAGKLYDIIFFPTISVAAGVIVYSIVNLQFE